MNLESYLERRIEVCGDDFAFLGIPVKEIPILMTELLKEECLQCLGSERAASYLAGIISEDWDVCSPKFNYGGIPLPRPKNLSKEEFIKAVCRFFYAEFQ